MRHYYGWLFHAHQKVFTGSRTLGNVVLKYWRRLSKNHSSVNWRWLNGASTNLILPASLRDLRPSLSCTRQTKWKVHIERAKHYNVFVYCIMGIKVGHKYSILTWWNAMNSTVIQVCNGIIYTGQVEQLWTGLDHLSLLHGTMLHGTIPLRTVLCISTLTTELVQTGPEQLWNWPRTVVSV